MKKIAIQLVHPNSGESRVNKALIKAVENLENVTVYNLYEKYPNYKIDVEALSNGTKIVLLIYHKKNMLKI